MSKEPLSPSSGGLIRKSLDGPMVNGRVVSLQLRPARGEPALIVDEAELIAGQGIEGDHYTTRHNGARQLTLIAGEDVDAVAAFLDRAEIDPALTRRNIVTRGINLIALKSWRFRIGSAICQGSGNCAPCGLMEEALGAGGFNAMRGRGGITARIVETGTVRVGDRIVPLYDDSAG